MTEEERKTHMESVQVSLVSGESYVAPLSLSPPVRSIVLSHIPRTISIVSSGLTSNVSLDSDRSTPSALRPCDDETVDTNTGGCGTSKIQSQDSSVESSLCDIVTEPRGNLKIVSRKRKISVCASEKTKTAKKAYTVCVGDNSLKPLRILARPEDASVLNGLHVFVRQQIEVFTATKEDIAQPAPGRKNSIHLHQVGLRCIHCRHLPSRDRVKRAVCYPSSVGRVYHSVSDMKFDHFSHCKGLSKELRSCYEKLKAQGNRGSDRRSSGGASVSTAQYYHDAAIRMGLEDRREGIFMTGQVTTNTNLSQPPVQRNVTPCLAPGPNKQDTACQPAELCGPSAMATSFSNMAFYQSASFSAFQQALAHGIIFQAPTPLDAGKCEGRAPVFNPHQNGAYCVAPRDATVDSGSSMLLATPADPNFLNPIHCFVRRNVEVFNATQEDISAPSPGRKIRIDLGQVGIRCIHCSKLPLKQRVKRAVCYPPSVSGIYHCVSNMKFDHFASCRGLPDAARKEFSELRTSSKRRGGSTSNGSRGMSNSTAQFYHDSALRMGLSDTPMGIRFLKKEHDGISSLMIAAAATYPMLQVELDRVHQTRNAAVSEQESTPNQQVITKC